MRRSRDDTIERVRSALSRLPEVLEAYLFGSLARGEAQAHSDVDVAVFLDSAVRTDAGWGNAAEIGAAHMADLGRSDIEVVILNHATPLLYHRVRRDCERLFARHLRATTVREGYALSRYRDWVPQLAKIRAAESDRREHGEFGR